MSPSQDQVVQERKLNEIKEIVTKAGAALQLQNPVVSVDSSASSIGEGIMGDIYRASLQVSKNKPIKLVVKQAPKGDVHRNQALTIPAYQNEIYFYSKVCPALTQLESKHKIAETGVSIPEYVVSESIFGKEMIVLKDLTDEGFELRDKNEELDEEHLKLIFATYGRFHATSFCFKEENPAEFQKFKEAFRSLWEINLSNSTFVTSFRQDMKGAVEDSINSKIYQHIITKLMPYYSDDAGLKQIMLESVKYEGKYGCLLHGDCWSNNMMFKYNQSRKLEAVKFLDFQLAGYGSPVHDLTYFLHVGASQKYCSDWESLLLTSYYESFSSTVRKYGKDPETLLPKQALIDDWKKYSKLSMMLSTLLIKLKFLSVEDTVNLIESFKVPSTDPTNVGFADINYDKILYTKKMRNIFENMYVIDGL